MTEFIGNWTDKETKQFNNPGWALWKGRVIWTGWKKDDSERFFIKCKKLSSLVYWVRLASQDMVVCPACLGCQLGGCGYCRRERNNRAALLAGKVEDYDKH